MQVVEASLSELGSAPAGPTRDALEARISAELSRWAREMEALGARAGEDWSVRFEAKEGAFSWRWPERELAYFEEGRSGDRQGRGARIRIQ